MIDKQVLDICHKHHYNGTLLISKDHQIISEQAVGFADFEHGIKMSLNTKIRIASISKQITAFAVLQLVYNKQLSLNTTIDRFYPDYEGSSTITIHHLLSNTSGLPAYPIDGDYQDLANEDDYYDAFIKKHILTKPLEFEPGERFEYNGSSYLMLTSIIEKVSSLPYDKYLKSHIFEPLRMNNTGFDFINVDVDNMATPYEILEEERILAPTIDLRIAGGGGGLYSTVLDLHKWNQSLFQGILLPKEYVDKMFTTYVEIIEHTGYGYGFFLEEEPVDNILEKVYYHTGGGPGVRSINTFFINHNTTLTMLSNVNDRTAFQSTREEIYQLLR